MWSANGLVGWEEVHQALHEDFAGIQGERLRQMLAASSGTVRVEVWAIAGRGA